MAVPDRVRTPAGARALLSWRLPVGIGVGAAMLAAGIAWPLSIVIGAAAWGGLVVAALPHRKRRPRIDPFAVSEPWRQHVQAAQRSVKELHRTIRETAKGPLRERMESIAARLDDGLDETWRIARRGDRLDAAIKRLDPTALRSRQTTLEERARTDPSAEVASALASVESQLEATERMKARSARTADRLRLTQVRYDELVVRATEVSLGDSDTGYSTEKYAHDVDDLVVELESLRLAMDEVSDAES